MTCSSLLIGFVKRTFKDSHASLVEKLVERAHILESNLANERLEALRNVDPGERMATGDIFIAPPPDYQMPAEASSSQQHSSQQYASQQSPPAIPEPSSHSRTATQPSPHYSPPAHANHSRSHSDPVILSPGFSSASTLHSDSSSPIVYTNYPNASSYNKFAFDNDPASYSAPTSTSFLLPATTYDGGLSQHIQINRPLSLYPGGAHVSHRRNESNLSTFPPRVSYTPEERAISFIFPQESAFDTHSVSESNRSSDHLLDDIDDAIDQCFRYSVVPKRKELVEPELELVLLPSTTYDPRGKVERDWARERHSRKDSVLPAMCLEKELPPTPLYED
jgi:hypothetical protein